MNIIKRYMGFILVLAIALTSLNIVSYASETVEETVEETVVLPNERFTTAADVFVHLGVFEQTPDFTATLLREEFARIITKAMKLPLNDSVRDGVFADVPGKYKEAPYIAAATEAGIFTGKDNNLFHPHEFLKEDEAVIALVNATGYREKVKLSGGTVSAYLQEAGSIGITDGVTIVAGENITYEKLLVLMYNAFLADMLVIEEFDGTRPVFSVVEDATLFNELYEVHEDKGVVIADRYTYLDGARFGIENTIVIDDGETKTEYDCSLTGGEELLGYRVEYTYIDDEEKGIRTLVGIKADKKNEIISVQSEDIEKSEQGKISYDNGNDRIKDIKIPDDIAVIYNGMAFAYADTNTYKPQYGKLTFLDNDSDGKYDVVFIEEYMSIVLGAIDKDNLILYPDMRLKGVDELTQTDGTKIPDYIDIDDSRYLSITKDGKTVSMARLKKGEVVTVMQSDARSGEIITRLIVSSAKVSGTVKQTTVRNHSPYIGIDPEGNRKETYGLETVTIDDTAYDIAGDVMMTFEFGLTGDFLLDFNGKIVGRADSTAVKSLYSYLINAGYDDETNQIYLKMLYENGIYTVEYIDQKLKVDENNYNFDDSQSAQRILDRLSKASGYTGVGSGGYAQPLKVMFKGDGTISNIETLLDKTGSVDTYENSSGLKKSKGEAGKALMYKSYTGIFDGEFAVDANTVVFQVRMDPTVKTYDVDNFVVTNNSVFDNDSTYNVVAYDMSQAGLAPMVVAYYTNDLLKQGGIMIVDKVQKVWSEAEEQVVTRITGYYYNGNKVTVDAMPDKTINSNLTEGDVIRALMTKAGRLYNYTMVYDNEETIPYSEGLPASSSDTKYTAMVRVVHGHVESIEGNFFTVNYGENTRVYSLVGAKVFVYDGDKVQTGAANDLIGNKNRVEVMDKVVVYTSAGRVRSVFVYKGGVR